MNINKVITIFGLWALFACVSRDHYSPEVEEALALSGDNRKELVKVLKHYAQSPADSLKFRAAEFLIANMPGKYSKFYDAPWNDVATVCLRWTSSSNKQLVSDTYRLNEPVKKEDVKYITAAYLINNIELAFQSWQDKPWGKHISFETFCEEILPYRVDTEPLENWREKALASFHDLNMAFQEDSSITVIDACCKTNNLLPRFRLDKDFPPMNYSQLMASTRSMCNGETALAAFVMRALGIPVTIDFTPHWGFYPTGHNWNSVCDSAGKHISFMGAESNPYESHQGNTMRKGKAYRKTFKHHRIIPINEKHIPLIFKENCIDISHEHDNCIDAEIPVKYQPDIQTGYAYLALLYDFEWHIVGYGSTNGHRIRFPSIGKNIIYLPVYYTDGKQTPAGFPFRINNEGNIHFLDTNSPDTLLTFRVIATDDDKKWFDRMVGGVFEGAGKSDFSDAKTIYTIKNMPDVYNDIVLKTPVSYRYVRYKSPDGSYGNVSEIAFSNTNGDKIQGVHIGSSGSWNNQGATGNKAIDNDLTTFYNAAEENGAWTGLDMKQPHKIATIHYTPRLNGFGVYKGHEYELFYWNKDGWKSFGKQTASGTELMFRVPQNSLLYFYNHTFKKKGQPFFIIDNNMFFYQ
jgi:hypothetical protein